MFDTVNDDGWTAKSEEGKIIICDSDGNVVDRIADTSANQSMLVKMGGFHDR